jgi:5-methylcytosine-specific restriction protein A
MRRLRQKAYQSKEWRELRDTYIKMHPLCEECIKKNIVTPAVDVHHLKTPFSKGTINYTLLLDMNNLESVCKVCHAEIHNKQQGNFTVQDVLRQLADLLDNKNENDDKC